jgi:hypothetical protein
MVVLIFILAILAGIVYLNVLDKRLLARMTPEERKADEERERLDSQQW